MALSYILFIVFAHWFSDFVLQTDWMAKNKSKDNRALAAHAITYTSSLLIIMIMAMPHNWSMAHSILIWVIVNGYLHFLTDYITSRITSKLWSENKVHHFFVMVGFDQMIHYTTLFTTFVFLVQ